MTLIWANVDCLKTLALYLPGNIVSVGTETEFKLYSTELYNAIS